MTAMRDRQEFARDVDRALANAARARRRARQLDRRATRSDRLMAGIALVEAIDALTALRDEIAIRLGNVRRHSRSHHAYSRCAALGGATRGGKP